MKEQYDAPKTEVIHLEEEDIILTSTGPEAITRTESARLEIADNPEGAGTFF